MNFKRVKPMVALSTVILLSFFSGCVSLTPPKSFDENVAYADGTLTGVVNGTAASLDAHQISSSKAIEIRTIAQNAAQFTDAARQAGPTVEGQRDLALATSILQQLQTYLNEKSAAK